MKLKNKFFIGISALFLSMTILSCDNFLDQPPKDLLPSDGFYQTASQAEQGVIGVYSDLRYVSDYEYLMMSECRSDNAWVEPRTNGQRDYSDIGTFRATSSLGTFESTWNAWYKVIYDANVALQKIPKTSFTNADFQKQLLGELHFLRGWAYFELVRLYGNVPMITTPLTPAEANATPQTKGLDIINQLVIPDLQQAQTLPGRGEILNAQAVPVPSEGRADCVAANAMLARVYMTLAGYPFNDPTAIAKAKICLNTVLTKKSDYWAPTIEEWRKQWTPAYANKYSIFAIQYRTGGNGNPAIFDFSPALPPSYTTVRIFGNQIYIDKSLRYEFDKVYSSGSKDLRGEEWSILDGYSAEPNFPAYSNTKESVTVDGATTTQYVNSMFYKFMPSKHKLASLSMTLDESSLKDYNDWPVNFPVLRIEDMMLLNSEILIQEGKIADALDAVNEIRQRAGCDLVPTDVDAATALNYVKRERRIELMGEGVRWFDEVRYGTWKQNTIDKFNRYNNPVGTAISDVSDGRYIYPIPENQMNIKPGTYVQNTGY
ncbi:MAG TPA: RagB/SusD family nutrient uptake outer membrane protein [Prevotella sp.]|nr:RagB/SusD family nutrient uptake outer membrane protein [Prevotella sp.]